MALLGFFMLLEKFSRPFIQGVLMKANATLTNEQKIVINYFQLVQKCLKQNQTVQLNMQIFFHWKMTLLFGCKFKLSFFELVTFTVILEKKRIQTYGKHLKIGLLRQICFVILDPFSLTSQ